MNRNLRKPASFLICCIYGPPGGCGALSNHVISWCLRPALRPSEAKHVLPIVTLLITLHCVFGSWHWYKLRVKVFSKHFHTTLQDNCNTYPVHVLLHMQSAQMLEYTQCGKVLSIYLYSGCWHLHIPLHKPQLLQHIAPLILVNVVYVVHSFVILVWNFFLSLHIFLYCSVSAVTSEFLFRVKCRVLLSYSRLNWSVSQ